MFDSLQAMDCSLPGSSVHGISQVRILEWVGIEPGSPALQANLLPSEQLSLLIYLPAILIPSCDSSSPTFHMMCSAQTLNKQSNNIQSCHTPFPILKQSIVPCLVLTVIASWPEYRFCRRQVRWSGISISLKILHSLLWSIQNLSEKAMASHSSTLAWQIPWTEEPGRLQSMGSPRVRHDWATSLSLFTFMQWRRKWQPTPVFLPGEYQGQGSLVGYRLCGHRVRHDWSDLAAAAAYKIFSVVNEEVDVFLDSLAFAMIQWMAIWSLVPLHFLNPACISGSSRFTYRWRLAWRILSITLLACETSAILR